MNARPQDLPFAPAALHGLSEELLCSHHQNNYGGAVKRLNAIRAQLSALDLGATPGFQVNGLKQEELVATNSMLLHELYFGSMGGDGQPMVPAMALALEASFGSVARWREEFVAMGKALGGGVPILALDMYEHAYHMDFGAAAGGYVDAFMDNINWAAVYARYQAAVHGVGESLGATQDDLAKAPEALVLDVRRAGVFEQAGQVLPGSRWADPALVDQWASDLPAEQEVVVYCVYGHEVGRSTAMRLRAAGLNARFLLGGIDGWTKSGRPLEPKGAAS